MLCSADDLCCCYDHSSRTEWDRMVTHHDLGRVRMNYGNETWRGLVGQERKGAKNQCGESRVKVKSTPELSKLQLLAYFYWRHMIYIIEKMYFIISIIHNVIKLIVDEYVHVYSKYLYIPSFHQLTCNQRSRPAIILMIIINMMSVSSPRTSV